MPCVVDSIDDTVDNAYAGWPERLFVIDAKGTIAYSGAQGPWGFKPEEIEAWLKANVGAPLSNAVENSAPESTPAPIPGKD